MFRNMTSEPRQQPRRQPDPGAAARRRAADAGSPGAADAGSPGAADAGSPGAADAGSPGAADAGSPGAADAERASARDVSAETLAARKAGLASGTGAAAESRRTGRSPGAGEQVKLTDPKAMRALAHPVRMSLLELLEATGTVTATQASELLGESPANCAFHLRTLAKYGFVREAGGGRGRERPWERVHTRIQVTSEQEDPQATVTAGMLQRVWLDRVLERARNLLSANGVPAAWEHSREASQTVQFLTPEETDELAEEVLDVLRRYEDRRDHPSRRPDGAVPVEFLFFGYPLMDLAGLAEQARQDDQGSRPPGQDGQEGRAGKRRAP
jgi:predicted transcriptional regulator